MYFIEWFSMFSCLNIPQAPGRREEKESDRTQKGGVSRSLLIIKPAFWSSNISTLILPLNPWGFAKNSLSDLEISVVTPCLIWSFRGSWWVAPHTLVQVLQPGRGLANSGAYHWRIFPSEIIRVEPPQTARVVLMGRRSIIRSCVTRLSYSLCFVTFWTPLVNWWQEAAPWLARLVYT